jgi:hypothetical protein
MYYPRFNSSVQMSQSYVRGVKALQAILFQIAFSVAPLVVEVCFVFPSVHAAQFMHMLTQLTMTAFAMANFCGGPVIVWLTVVTFTVYTAFTVMVRTTRPAIDFVRCGSTVYRVAVAPSEGTGAR